MSLDLSAEAFRRVFHAIPFRFDGSKSSEECKQIINDSPTSKGRTIFIMPRAVVDFKSTETKFAALVNPYQHHKSVRHDPETIGKLRVSGHLEHAHIWQSLTLQKIGNVTVLRGGEQITYPIHPGGLQQWIRVMKKIMATKQEIELLMVLVTQASFQENKNGFQSTFAPWPTFRKPKVSQNSEDERKRAKNKQKTG